MTSPFADVPTPFDLATEDGALVFPMPVEAYDCIMNHEMLPRGACYNGQRETLEVEPTPNGIQHDRRTVEMHVLLHHLALKANVPALTAATSPVEGAGGDRRHPDASLIVDPAKVRLVDEGVGPDPAPDLVVEVDYTPLSHRREQARTEAYVRLNVPEVWTWKRTGGEDHRPVGRTSFHVLRDGRFVEVEQSAVVPGMRPKDMDALMHEPRQMQRDRMAIALAERLAPAFGLAWKAQARTSSDDARNR